MKRPELPVGALRDLKDALHQLHISAGKPSTRRMRDEIYSGLVGEDTPSHTHIWNVFAQPSLPERDFMSAVVYYLATRTANVEPDREVDRLLDLWTAAATTERQEEPEAQLDGLDPDLAEAWLTEQSKPLRTPGRRPTPAFHPHNRAVRHLQRSVWGLYVDAGLPSVAETVAAMGYAPNSRELIRQWLPSPHRMTSSTLSKLIVFLAKDAGYEDPQLIAQSIELLRRASTREP